jgi:hypothetical protein
MVHGSPPAPAVGILIPKVIVPFAPVITRRMKIVSAVCVR